MQTVGKGSRKWSNLVSRYNWPGPPWLLVLLSSVASLCDAVEYFQCSLRHMHSSLAPTPPCTHGDRRYIYIQANRTVYTQTTS